MAIYYIVEYNGSFISDPKLGIWGGFWDPDIKQYVRCHKYMTRKAAFQSYNKFKALLPKGPLRVLEIHPTVISKTIHTAKIL